jgi:adenylate kinase
MMLAGPVLLLGPPTSGKGTQAALLAGKCAVPHVSLGEILRFHVQSGGTFAEDARPFLAAGMPVPVSLMSRVLIDRLCASDVERGFIGDGLVRTIAQARELDAILTNQKMQLSLVIHIGIPREEILSRMLHRLWCPRCGASYKRDPLNYDMLASCPTDGESLVHRADDSDKIVEIRVQAHEKSLHEIFPYYQERGLLQEIDGARSIDSVHADIFAFAANRFRA